jgi:hypothetical protein
MSGGAGSVTDGLREKVRFCEGFSDAGQRYALRKHRAGVREATMHEVALAQWCNALAVPRGEPFVKVSRTPASDTLSASTGPVSEKQQCTKSRLLRWCNALAVPRGEPYGD